MSHVTVQTLWTFASHLKSIGVPIPSDVVKITVSCLQYDTPVRIVFHVLSVCDNEIFKDAVQIIKEDGSELLAQDFYSLLKDELSLPGECTSFFIEADAEKVVTLQTNSAFPLEAVEKLRGFTFKHHESQ